MPLEPIYVKASSSSCDCADSLESFSPSVPTWPSLLASLLCAILCLHRAEECTFLLVSQHWCVHV